MNTGVLHDMVCVAIAEEAKDAERVLIVNASLSFVGKSDKWILANSVGSRFVQESSPVVAAATIPHDFVVCNELASFELVDAVLAKSATHGAKRAIVIGDYNLKSQAAANLRTRWSVRQCMFGRNTFVLDKITKSVRERNALVNREENAFNQMMSKICARQNK